MAAVLDVKRRSLESAILELSADEVHTLQAILACVGGDPDSSPRKHKDSVVNAIQEVTDVEDYRDLREFKLLQDEECEIHFERY